MSQQIPQSHLLQAQNASGSGSFSSSSLSNKAPPPANSSNNIAIQQQQQQQLQFQQQQSNPSLPLTSHSQPQQHHYGHSQAGGSSGGGQQKRASSKTGGQQQQQPFSQTAGSHFHQSSQPINGIRTDVDPNKLFTVPAREGLSGNDVDLSYTSLKPVGNGSFGVVFQAKIVQTGELTAIKQVLQDKRFKNRELQIMRMLNHTNVVSLRYFFYSNGDKKDEVFLNLVLEFVPETVYKACRHYAKLKQPMPPLFVKLYTYQMLRSLAYIHAYGICHRDIKPQNLLLDPQRGVLKLCDFGSAKMLIKGEPNVSYICSRYYRAPELIFGATDYTPAIDVWSAGCVMAEMILGTPLFPGESGVDQLVEIIKILGTPTREQIKSMNQNYTDFKFPAIKANPWQKVFKNRAAPDCLELIAKLLEYTPTSRFTAIEAMTHHFFDELRLQETTLPNGKPLPLLFNFTPMELSIRPDLIPKLVPQWMWEQYAQQGIDLKNFVPIKIEVPQVDN
ncbi:hypothetical protein MP228_006809 [Amoeboaphelidium protococcarum]|nr:hypothetical protein MP228_006809 [Amoeboaphelidium protococcarum]